MVRRICKITLTIGFIFRRLVICIREDVSFNIICLDVLEGIKQFYLSMWFKKKRLEALFIGDNVKALIKNVKLWKLCLLFLCENCSIYGNS